jgi:membrane protease YdiL (CAAX protease family)
MAKPAGTGGALSVKPRRCHRRPLAFFSLVFILSIPFWIIGQASPAELLPALPVGALMLLTPVIAASILVYQEEGAAGVRALLQRAFDFIRIPPLWYVPLILLMPCLTVVSYGLMRLMRAPLPHPEIPLLLGLALWPALVAGAMAEELGWSGYAIDPLQERWGALPAAIVVGIVWAVWHIIPLLQAHRTAGWIAWWGLGTVGSRVVIVWLYNNTGRSVFAASLYHGTLNLCWQLFPNRGSHYDPRITSLLIISVATIVTILSHLCCRRSGLR